MWETIIAAWFIVVGSIWTVGFLTLFTLWLVHESCDGWAILFLLVLAAIAYHIFKLDTMTLLIGAAAYIPIGIMWSFYRWKRYCNSKVEEFNERYSEVEIKDEETSLTSWNQSAGFDPNVLTKEEKERKIDQLTDELLPGNNISRLVNWIIIWPFSIVDNVLGDIYDMIVALVKKHLINLYKRISNDALSKID